MPISHSCQLCWHLSCPASTLWLSHLLLSLHRPSLVYAVPDTCSVLWWWAFCEDTLPLLFGWNVLPSFVPVHWLQTSCLLSVDKKWHVKSSHLRHCVLSFWDHDEVHDPKKLKEERVYFSLQFQGENPQWWKRHGIKNRNEKDYISSICRKQREWTGSGVKL